MLSNPYLLSACSTMDCELRCETYSRASGDVIFPEEYFHGSKVQGNRENHTGKPTS